MPVGFWIAVGFYLVILNFAAAITAIADKRRAKRHAWRISETTLLMLGLIGGALLEWITMLMIRHKTRHPKFMISLPLFAALHAGILIAVGILFH